MRYTYYGAIFTNIIVFSVFFIYLFLNIAMKQLCLFTCEIKQSIRFVYHWRTEYHTSFHSHPCASMNLESQYFNVTLDLTRYIKLFYIIIRYLHITKTFIFKSNNTTTNLKQLTRVLK